MSVEENTKLIKPNTFVETLKPYVPGKAISELARELGIAKIIKLASNENPLGASVHSCYSSISCQELARYPDANGFDLKNALAHFHQVQVNQITLGNGSNDVIDMVIRAYLEPQQEILVSEYAFSVYKIIAQSLGIKVIEVKSKNFGHDLKAMLKAITPNTRVVFIANPNNPTGTFLTTSEIESFISQVPNNVMVVLDEAYREYVEEEVEVAHVEEWLHKYPNVVFTRTFSKAYGLAGLRVGYALSSKAIADMLNRVRQPFNVNVVGLKVAQEALKDQKHIKKSAELNRQQRHYLCNQLEKMKIEYIPSMANFVTFNVHKSGTEVYQNMLYRGIIVRPLGEYQMPTYLRVSVGLPHENEAFIRALTDVLSL